MGRDYDKYIKLKELACLNINKDNAMTKLTEAKSALLTKLHTLNVRDLTQVEDLYLIVAPLTQAASYVAANDRASRKNQSFDEALQSIGTDDVFSILEKTFEGQSKEGDFSKFNDIDRGYKPSKQAWAGLHARIDTVAKKVVATTTCQQTTDALKVTIPQYLAHLDKKLKEHGIELPDSRLNLQMRSPKVTKLFARYSAIKTLNETLTISPILNEQQIAQAKEVTKTCLNSKPDWSERPFLQKLTDVLSLGFKPLYRAFTSKEKDYQATISNIFKPPKMGR